MITIFSSQFAVNCPSRSWVYSGYERALTTVIVIPKRGDISAFAAYIFALVGPHRPMRRPWVSSFIDFRIELNMSERWHCEAACRFLGTDPDLRGGLSWTYFDYTLHIF